MRPTTSVHKKVMLFFIAVVPLTFMFTGYSEGPTEEPTQKSLLQQLVDSYVSSSNTNKTLKHLLDAKMYLSSAEHDLLVSHDKESAKGDIENTLLYLKDAEKVALLSIKNQIAYLINDLKKLEIKTSKAKESGKNSETDELLAKANQYLQDAKQNASAEIQKDITDITTQINNLRGKIEHDNLREAYESVMVSLSHIISNL